MMEFRSFLIIWCEL